MFDEKYILGNIETRYQDIHKNCNTLTDLLICFIIADNLQLEYLINTWINSRACVCKCFTGMGISKGNPTRVMSIK